jgi:hypothetical protein
MAVVMKMMNTLWLFNVATVWEMAPTQLDEDDDDDNDDDCCYHYFASRSTSSICQNNFTYVR